MKETREDPLVDTYQGWDEGVTEMSLGERSILTISGYERIPKPQRLIPRCWREHGARC